VEQRDHDGRGGQDDQGRLEQPRIEMRFQPSVSVRGQEAVECLRHKTWRLDAGKVPGIDFQIFGAWNLPRHWLY